MFAFGTNDAAEEAARVRVAPGDAVDNLAQMIDLTRDGGLDVFVVGPPPAGDPAQDERVRDLSAAFARVARERAVPFVETVAALSASAAWTREAAQDDGSHPAAGGYRALAELVLAGGWLEWVRSARSG